MGCSLSTLNKQDCFQGMPLGGAKILSSPFAMDAHIHTRPQMGLTVLLLNEFGTHKARVTVPGLIVFWRKTAMMT